MLSQTVTQIMTHVNKLPPQSRLHLVQLTLNTLMEQPIISQSTPTNSFNGEPNKFRSLRGITTVKMSTNEIMSITRGEK